jgi:hypothetical protein
LSRIPGERPGTICRCMLVLALATSAAGKVSAQSPLAAVPSRGRQTSSLRITLDNARFNNYLRDLAGPRALVGIVGGSALEQLRGNNSLEFGTQLAERATRHAAEVSVRDGLAALMNRSTDYHYQFCGCHGFGPRVAHALVESFSDRRADGSRAFSVPRVAGAYAGDFTGLAWEHDRSVGNVAASATLSLGLSALFNVARELTGIGRPH